MREGRHHLLSFVQVEAQGGMNQWQAAAAAAQAAAQAAQAAQAACGAWAPWAVPLAPAPKAAAQNGKVAVKGQPGKWATRNKEQRERRKERLRLGREVAERSQNKEGARNKTATIQISLLRRLRPRSLPEGGKHKQVAALLVTALRCALFRQHTKGIC